MAKHPKFLNHYQLAYLFRCSVDEIRRRVKREKLPYAKRTNGVLYFDVRKAIDWHVRWYEQRIKLEVAKRNQVLIKEAHRARGKEQRTEREQRTVQSIRKPSRRVWILSTILDSPDVDSLAHLLRSDGAAAPLIAGEIVSPRAIKKHAGSTPKATT